MSKEGGRTRVKRQEGRAREEREEREEREREREERETHLDVDANEVICLEELVRQQQRAHSRGRNGVG